MNIIEALGLSALGMLIVFAVLLLLMLVIYVLSVTLGRKQEPAQKPAGASPQEKSAASETSAPKEASAPGSAGEICMFDVPDKEAAMIMAIVADKLDAPLNELRFLSIKEVKDNEI